MEIFLISMLSGPRRFKGGRHCCRSGYATAFGKMMWDDWTDEPFQKGQSGSGGKFGALTTAAIPHIFGWELQVAAVEVFVRH